MDNAKIEKIKRKYVQVNMDSAALLLIFYSSEYHGHARHAELYTDLSCKNIALALAYKMQPIISLEHVKIKLIQWPTAYRLFRL